MVPILLTVRGGDNTTLQESSGDVNFQYRVSLISMESIVMLEQLETSSLEITQFYLRESSLSDLDDFKVLFLLS